MTGTFRFLEFYAGVFSLVALSLTVMGGLAATDRILLMVHHRILLQGLHRSVATASVVFLGVHVLTKVAEGHASLLDAVVPFLASHRVLYMGLGTVAGYLMIAVTVTGILRGRFADADHPWLWRALHATAYACWPVALLHGLNAGRAAKTWVTLSYVLCLVLVGLALMARLWVTWGKQLRAPRTRTTATLRPLATVIPSRPQAEPVAASRRPDSPRRAGSPGWDRPSMAELIVAEFANAEPAFATAEPAVAEAEPARPASGHPRLGASDADLGNPGMRSSSFAGSGFGPAGFADPTPGGAGHGEVDLAGPDLTATGGRDGQPDARSPEPVTLSSDPEGPIRPGSRVSASYRSAHSSGRAPRQRQEANAERGGADEAPPASVTGRWTNASTDTITDEEFWACLREELR